MLKLFTKQNNIRYPVKKVSNIDKITFLTEFELNKVKNYNRSRESRVNNRNILARIIDVLDIDYNLDIIDYLIELDARHKFVSKTFNITSSIFKGKTMYSEIYKNSTEIFMLIDTNIDPFNIEGNWKDIESVRLLKHDNTDLKFHTPDFDDTMYGNYIIGIDIRALLIQYKQWSLYRVSNDMSTDSTYFIYQYVYSNMLESYFNISMYNRLVYIHNDILIPDTTNRYPFSVRNLSRKIDKVLKEVLKNTKNKNMRYEALLQTIPNIFNVNKNSKDTLYLNMVFNNNNYWVFVLSKLEYILFFINLLGKNGIKSNKELISNLRLDIKTLNRNNYLEAGHKDTYDNDYKYFIDDITSIIGSR